MRVIALFLECAAESRRSAAPRERRSRTPGHGQGRAATLVAAVAQILASTIAIIVVLRR